MALAECIKCGSKISEQAITCPKCGSGDPFGKQGKAELAECIGCGEKIFEKDSVCPKCGSNDPLGKQLFCSTCRSPLPADFQGACPECGEPHPKPVDKKRLLEEERKKSGRIQCPICRKWDVIRGAYIEDGNTGEWCPNCKKSLQNMKKLSENELAKLRGQIQDNTQSNTDDNKNVWTAGLLCFFLGGAGAHRFYAGKTGTGLLQIILLVVSLAGLYDGWGLFPLAILCFWSLADFLMIVTGEFRDKKGIRCKDW